MVEPIRLIGGGLRWNGIEALGRERWYTSDGYGVEITCMRNQY